jgi:DNA-binding response OmpR family regulator
MVQRLPVSPDDASRIPPATDRPEGAPAPGQTAPAQTPATAAPDPSDADAAATARSTPARILVVDDLAEIRDLLQVYLEDEGYQVLTAGNGEEALAAVATHPPDLILLDIMMPGTDGYEVCRRLKSNEKTAFIPIVMLTALQDLEHRLQGIELGTDEYLTKPFRRLELLTRVRSLLRVKALHDQVAAYNRLLEQKVAERTAALERALEDLREIDRLKSEFLSNISHELRTPLTPIMGYLPALLREEFGGLSPDQRRVLTHVSGSVERLHRLIDDLLTFMHWESGETDLRVLPMAVAAVVQGAAAKVSAPAQEKDVHVLQKIPADLPPIQVDATAIGRALGHLLDNAGKFTPKGGQITISAHLVRGQLGNQATRQSGALQESEGAQLPGRQVAGLPEASREAKWVELAVQDTGVGIPPRGHPQDLRPLLPGGFLHNAAARGNRPGPRHREAHPRCPRRPHHGRESPRHGDYLFDPPASPRIAGQFQIENRQPRTDQ